MSRSATDAVCALGCWAAVAVGAALAWAGCDELLRGGGDLAIVVAGVGETLVIGGAGAAVLLAGVRRG